MKKLIEWLKNIGRIEKIIKRQLYQDFLIALRTQSPDHLLLKGYGVYSQNDEDGIIQEIFKRIKTKNKVAVEVAVGSGLESNTHLLLQTGWQCFWFESSSSLVEQIKVDFTHWLKNKRLILTEGRVEEKTIVQLFHDRKIPKGVDLLSLDIDGHELSLWNAVASWKPRVVVIEYNAALGPDVAVTAQTSTYEAWDNHSMNFGASLQAICRVADRLGYSLVCCNYTGVNAFFVQKKYASKFSNANQAEDLFQPPRLGDYIKTGFQRTPFVWQQQHD